MKDERGNEVKTSTAMKQSATERKINVMNNSVSN